MRTYHLYRRLSRPPFKSWACSIRAAATDAGYEVVGSDPAVADGGFLALVASHLGKTTRMKIGGTEDGQYWDGTQPVGPGEPGFLGTAIRQIPGTVIGGAPS